MFRRFSLPLAAALMIGAHALPALALDSGMKVGGTGRVALVSAGAGRPTGDSLSSLGVRTGALTGGRGLASVVSGSLGGSTDKGYTNTGGGPHIVGGKGRSTDDTRGTTFVVPIVRGIGITSAEYGGLGM